MALTRMIFAIQMTDPNPTRLRVSGDIGTPAPAMTYLRRGDSKPSPPVDCVDGAWTMDLDAGDYLVELRVEDWIPGRLDIVAELASGQSAPIFVHHGSLPGSSPSAGLAAWKDAALCIDSPESSAVSDSKDPWPPPPPPPPWAPLAPDSAAWFAAELTAARLRIAGQIAGKSMPADAITGS